MIIFTLNARLLFLIGFRDIGGSTYIHVFGAFYGATASWIYSRKYNSKDNPNNKASYGTNTLAFIGTAFT